MNGSACTVPVPYIAMAARSAVRVQLYGNSNRILPVQRTSTAVQAVFSITQHITCTIPRYIASLLTGSW